MKISHRQKGQTLIETAIILVLLLLIVFGITEFARAWFTKNSLKNAARQGARVAAVTSQLNLPITPFACNDITVCPNSDVIINATCCQPGVPMKANPQCTYNTTVTLCCGSNCPEPPNALPNPNTCDAVVANDPVKVRIQSNFCFAIGGHRLTFLGMNIWPWPQSMPFSTEATMRYE